MPFFPFPRWRSRRSSSRPPLAFFGSAPWRVNTVAHSFPSRFLCGGPSGWRLRALNAFWFLWNPMHLGLLWLSCHTASTKNYFCFLMTTHTRFSFSKEGEWQRMLITCDYLIQIGDDKKLRSMYACLTAHRAILFCCMKLSGNKSASTVGLKPQLTNFVCQQPSTLLIKCTATPVLMWYD
jgi:hypothetical protein